MGPLSLVGQKTILTIQMVESTTKTLWLLMRRTIRKGINWKTNPMVLPIHMLLVKWNTQRLMTLLVEMVVTVPLVNMDLTKPASLWPQLLQQFQIKKSWRLTHWQKREFQKLLCWTWFYHALSLLVKESNYLRKSLKKKVQLRGIQLLLPTRKKLGTWKFFLDTNM